MVQLTIRETQHKYRVKFTVIDDKHCTNLLEKSVAQQMGLVNVHYDIIRDKHTEEKIHAATHAPTETQTGLTIPQIVTDYADVFERLGQLGPELQLEVNDSIKPVQLPPRKILESLKAPLKAHLAELEKSGVIEKVHQPTDWISSIVAKKPNGKIRRCLDPRLLLKPSPKALPPPNANHR